MITADSQRRELFRSQGYVVLPRLIDVPTELEPTANSDRTNALDIRIGSATPPQALVNFPFPEAFSDLNEILIAPQVLDCAHQILGTSPILSQGLLWVRRPGEGYKDQDLHLDYMNHTLVEPDDPSDATYVEMIIYLTEIGPDDAPTFVVPQSEKALRPTQPYKRSREEDPELYELEQAVTVTAGSVLAFNTGTWHRGSALKSRTRTRWALHASFRTPSAYWVGHHSISGSAHLSEFATLVGSATPQQLESLGFPPAGHAYWTPESVAAVRKRYPGIDLSWAI